MEVGTTSLSGRSEPQPFQIVVRRTLIVRVLKLELELGGGPRPAYRTG
jgi:hypothetical protein